MGRSRIEQILNAAATRGAAAQHGHGVNQQAVQAVDSIRIMKQLWGRYTHSVATCLDMHHYYKTIYLQMNPSAQSLSEVAEHDGLFNLRQNAADHMEACIHHLEASELTLNDPKYAKTLFGLEFMRDQCGINCPLLELPIHSLPRRCGPGVFVGLP